MIYGYGGLTLTTACSDDAEGGESGDAAGTSGSSDNSSSGSSSGDTDCVEREYLGVDPILPPGGVNAVKFRSLHFQSCVFNLWWDASNITVQAGSAGDAVLLSMASEDGDISGPIITIAKQDTSEVEPHATKVAAMGRAGSQPDAAAFEEEELVSSGYRSGSPDHRAADIIQNSSPLRGGSGSSTISELQHASTACRLGRSSSSTFTVPAEEAAWAAPLRPAVVSQQISVSLQPIYIFCVA